MGGIFISYRREDSGPYAGRLRDALSGHFGTEQVFRDIDTINPGERFLRIVEREVSSCDALLAVIGPMWLTIRDTRGRRRLENPEDYVRLEIAAALARGDDVLVIPVLVGTTSMPAAADLPEPLASLAECNAVRFTDEGWDDQVARLTRALDEKVVPRPVGPSPLQVAVPQAEVTRGAVPRTQQREHAVEKLVESVHLQWEEEAKIRGLFDPDPMPVHWTLTEHNVSDHSRHISPGPLIFDGSSDRIDELTEQFLTLSRRRLVILGAPGSGKTTLAVQLLLRLLEVRTAAEPVPVLLTANGWDTTTHPRLRDWLAFRLGKDYPALRAIDEAMPGELADNGMVLPVIDGLDELDPDYRPALLSTLNDSLAGTDPLVLTCRTDEYVDAVDNADVLTAAAVIEARPLTAPAAADYLDGCLPPRQRPGWDPILDTLRGNDDTPVADVCSTPLGLWLLRSVYIENKGDPTPLVDPARYPDAHAIKAHLFDQLIPALITKRRPVPDGSDPLRPRRDWQPDPTRRWLGYLAVQLHGQRDLRWWHLPSAVPARVTTTLAVLVDMWAFGLVFGLVVVLASRVEDLPAAALASRLTFSLTVLLVVALAFIPTSGRRMRRTPGRGHLARELARALAFGLAGVLMLVLMVGLAAVAHVLMGERGVALVFGPVVALAVALTVGKQIRRTPEPGYANLRIHGRGRDLAWNLAVGLAGLLAFISVFVLVFWLAFGLTEGLATLRNDTLMFGLSGSSHAPWHTLMFGLGMALSFGLAVGLVRWVRSPGSDDRSRTPTSAYRHSRNLTVLVGLAFGLGFGPEIGVAIGLVAFTPTFGPVIGLAVGLAVASAFGLAVAPANESAWFGFVVTARWLAFRGKLPWKIMGFLDDAHRLGLLRTAGSVYQFRHAELQDHLAKSRGDRSTSATEITDDADRSKLSS